MSSWEVDVAPARQDEPHSGCLPASPDWAARGRGQRVDPLPRSKGSRDTSCNPRRPWPLGVKLAGTIQPEAGVRGRAPERTAIGVRRMRTAPIGSPRVDHTIAAVLTKQAVAIAASHLGRQVRRCRPGSAATAASVWRCRRAKNIGSGSRSAARSLKASREAQNPANSRRQAEHPRRCCHSHASTRGAASPLTSSGSSRRARAHTLAIRRFTSTRASFAPRAP